MRLDNQTGVLEGREEVLFTNRTGIPLESLLFRLYPNYLGLLGGFEHHMVVGGVIVDGAPAMSEYTASNTGLIVHMLQPLLAEDSVAVEMSFSMLLAPIGDEALWLNFPYPMLAVHDESGWRADVPTNGDTVFSESAMYTVEFTRPRNTSLAASGTAKSSSYSDDDTISTVILAPGMRDVTLMLSDSLQRSSQPVDGVTINIWHTADDPLTDEKLATVASAMRTFDQFFGAYPYSEFDVVAVYDSEYQGSTGGGMEYSGITSYHHGSEGWEYSLVHEVAHQWWFGVVGNDTQMEPWLDEAMAEYAAYLYFLEVYGEVEAMRALEANVIDDYLLALDSGRIRGTEPVGSSIYDFPPFSPNYAPIVYAKGALFLDQLRARMGEAVFLEFLQEYYRRFKYDVATGEEFLQVAEEVSRRDFEDLYDEWVRK
jgi:hypothetical protein